ncbi:SxtJ family membrane protein [Roseibium sp. FZY0029]|uniref:SxtJ family membrane protein n=1 Tax=Roseibium sp. FZY0029 TaxID=3116647 RepID=UPI002EAEA787|nr:SxtJ family membrane protein [Roseibium sp. FZY0029]
MSDNQLNTSVRMGSERNFGLVFAAVFALIGLWPITDGAAPRWVLLGLSAVFIALAMFAPQVLRVPNRLWFKLGLLLGAVVAPIVMAIVYLVVLIPIGLAMRASGKDPLSKKMDPTEKSYWITRTEQPKSMRLQY